MVKFVTKLLKWYGIATVCLWTWVGCSHVFEKFADDPSKTSWDVDDEIINETSGRYKKFYNKFIRKYFK